MAPRPAPSLRWCPSCHRDVAQFAPGPSGRPDATCPYCGAHERHRFLTLLLDGLAPSLATARLVLDVAPSRQMTRVLRQRCPRGLVSTDLDPAADGRRVDVRASLTHLPLAAGSVDVMLCYHVLEHVPDDRAAMAEIARVLAPGGLGLVQVPYRAGTVTDEDPQAPVEERVRRFGQSDHVRYYGRDFDDRLAAAGLDVVRLTPAGVVGSLGCRLARLVPDEPVWLVRPSAAGGEPWRAVEGLQGTSTAYLLRLVAEARARARREGAALEVATARLGEMSERVALLEAERAVSRRPPAPSRLRRLARAVRGGAVLARARRRAGGRAVPP